MHVCAGQDRFEERWAQQVAPRIAEVDALMKVEEEALRQRIAEASVRPGPSCLEGGAGPGAADDAASSGPCMPCNPDPRP